MPTRFRRSALAFLAAALTAFTCLPPASATEHTRMEPVWIEAVGPDGEKGLTFAALLNLPPGWMFGDAAVLVLSDGPWPDLARERLIGALLGEWAAVLELDVKGARQAGSDKSPARPAPTVEELSLDVRAAVDVLRRDTGAGLVVAVGQGAGGEAALLAASRELANGPDRDRGGLVAAAALGPEPARFSLGGAEPGRGWPVRAELLCGVLAGVIPPPEAVRADAECRRALVAPSAALAVRAVAR
jgi:hypothetical protein